ncbi:MAG: poly-gamma-glutamate system protein [Candidatus Cloacimonetes bacterium]|nr:poly-gamma-glutamate system protein [Candidatus Cloacimonadota bacterium]
MFIPSAKSKISLLALLVVAMLLFVWVNNSRMFLKEKDYDKKLEAALLMKKAYDAVKQDRLECGAYCDLENDPYQSGVIGPKETPITTDRGSLDGKLTSLNPNYAAVMVSLMKRAHLNKGDRVAISCTGSYPAINLAVYAAATALELKVVPISSVGASMFGATDPDFTWLDMETLLYNQGIFPFKSVAASIGGGRDLGRGLNLLGRNMIVEAIKRNSTELVQEESLEANIEKKMTIYNSRFPKYDAYINIGGGLSSIGSSINGRLISDGYHRTINNNNLPRIGTMFLFAEQGTPIIHLSDFLDLARRFELPETPVPLPEPGTGSVFVNERYNVTIAIISLVILLALISIVVFFDHSQMKLRDEEVNRRA